MKSLILLVFCSIVGYAAALSCPDYPCDLSLCPEVTCGGELYKPFCQCCHKCKAMAGQDCGLYEECAKGLTCVTWDKSMFNPWGYSGKCIPDKDLSTQCSDFESKQIPGEVSSDTLHKRLEDLLKSLN